MYGLNSLRKNAKVREDLKQELPSAAKAAPNLFDLLAPFDCARGRL